MQALNQLIETMEMMIDAHSRLLQIAKEKRATLVEGNIQGLQTLVYRESSCADEIQKLEQKRKDIVQEYIENKGCSSHLYTIEEVLNTVIDQALETKINLIAKQLRDLVYEITHINESNQQLIQTSLSYVQFAMGILIPKEQAIGYGPKAAKRYSSLLDAKI